MIDTKDAPPFAGVYSAREAALYIRATLARSPSFPRINTQHISRWAREELGGRKVKRQPSIPGFINFPELVSFRMVAALRAKGVSSKDIKLAHTWLREKRDWQYPFAMEPVWVGDPDIFADEDTQAAIARFWESHPDFIKDIFIPVESNYHGLSFEVDRQAATWTPLEGIVLDPARQFGEPCIAGTRVPTGTLRAFHLGGDSVDTLARAYGLPLAQIESAMSWEAILEKSAAG